MAGSVNLITAHITFLPTPVALVHIPNEHYPFIIQPLLQILFGESNEDFLQDTPWTQRHEFLNFSVTPVGCSLVCSRTLVTRWLSPLVERLNGLLSVSQKPRDLVEINHDDYVVVRVDGQGLNAGERVLELTAPLAMAGISIFFISTYFSDFILVPCRARQTVVATLQQHGFVFSQEAEAYVSRLSPTLYQGTTSSSRPATSSSSESDYLRPRSASTPSTPPAKDVPELQIRTFTKLLSNGIEPLVDPRLRLLNCVSDRDLTPRDLDRFKSDLMHILLATNAPGSIKSGNGVQSHNLPSVPQGEEESVRDISASFMSITLTEDPVSILLEERLLRDSRLARNLLASRDEDEVLQPIILDLRHLGWRTTGIVGGVAGRLSQGSVSFEKRLGHEDEPDWHRVETTEAEPIEISFLSSAKAGSVIVRANQMHEALKALRMGMKEVQETLQ